MKDRHRPTRELVDSRDVIAVVQSQNHNEQVHEHRPCSRIEVDDGEHCGSQIPEIAILQHVLEGLRGHIQGETSRTASSSNTAGPRTKVQFQLANTKAYPPWKQDSRHPTNDTHLLFELLDVGVGNFQHVIDGIGAPWAICITPGPHQYLYSSNSSGTGNLDNGEIYKMELDGTILGKFGRAGRMLGEFASTHAIDCRDENELFVGEILSWRVQKITLHP